MKMNAIKRPSVKRMATLTLWIIIIIIFVLGLTLQMAIARRICINRGHEAFSFTLSDRTRKNMSGGGQRSNIPVNSIQQNKIEQIKRDLNDPALGNEAVLPVNRIGRYIFMDPNLCKTVSKVDCIIVVHTALSHFERRQRIRATFANTSLFYPIQIRVAFLLGITDNISLTRMLWFEHTTFKDTVMGDFTDDYHNLSIKGVMGYRWVKDHCPNADFVLKIDDDVLLNMFIIIHSLLPQMRNKKRSVFCNLLNKDRMVIHRNGKWKVASHMFPTRRTFPYDYCSGITVIMTPDLMDPLYRAAEITPYLWIDDIYLFGMLPLVIGNVSYHHFAFGKYMTQKYTQALNCTLTHGVRCPMFSTVIPDDQFWSYWKIIKDMYITADWTAYTTAVSRLAA